MACELSVQCYLVYRFLKYSLPEDTIDVHLKVHTLKGIHTFKKDWDPKPPYVVNGEHMYNPTPLL